MTGSCPLHPVFPVVGVCSICLHDRLLSLAAATATTSSAAASSSSAAPPSHPISPRTPPSRPISPLSGPIPASRNHSQPLFFSTPQLPGALPRRASLLSSLLSALRLRLRHAPSPAPPRRGPNRGMSPETSPTSLTDGLSPVRRLPAPTPARRCRRAPHAGFAACFGPLVRVAPQRRAHEFSGEFAFSGELRKSPALLRDRSRRFGRAR